MRAIILFIILGFCMVGLSFSQSQYFSKTLDLKGYREMTYSMLKVNDGYIITGGTSSGGSVFELFVSKLNWNGDTIWSRFIRDSIKSYTSGSINCIASRKQGGFYIYGEYKDTIGGNVDAILYCFNDSGDTLYTKLFGGTRFDIGVSIAESDCGDVYALGQSTSIADVKGDVFLVKLDSLGKVLWQKTYGIANVTDHAHTISIDGDHSIYLGTSYVGGWVGSLTNFVPRLIKVDSSGTQKFSRTVNTTDSNLPAGSFGVAHLHTANQIYLISRPSNDGYVGIIYVTIFDSLGVQISSKAIVGPRVLIALVDFLSLDDGSLLLCGQGNTIPSYTYNGWDSEDDGGLILKLSPNADSVWARYHIVHPGQYQSLFYAIEPSPFGGYFLAGTYVNGPVQDIWLMSVDANGCLGDDSCGVSQPVSITKDVEVRIGEGALLVYPNPVQDKMYIQIPDIYYPPSQAHSARKKSHHLYDPMHRAHSNLFLEQEIEALTPSTEVESPNSFSSQDCLLNLYAMDGRLIRSQSQAWSQTMELPVSDLPAGIYLLRVMQGGNVYAQKVVVGR
jgi:hypothetical protein